MSQNQPTVETFAIVPFAKWRAMEKRLKQQEEMSPPPSRQPSPEPVETAAQEPPKKKDLKGKYRKVQIKKLLQHLERLDSSQNITSLENIDALIEVLAHYCCG